MFTRQQKVFMKILRIPLICFFLDIQLPDDSGIEIGRFLRKCSTNTNLQIIFISGNPGYAMELFKIRPMDFLIKPFSEKEVLIYWMNILRKQRHQPNVFYINSKRLLDKYLIEIYYIFQVKPGKHLSI